MSELIDTHCTQTSARKQFLASASVLAVIAYIALSDAANAQSDHPALWIDLGGQLETMQGTYEPFSAPFMFPDTWSEFYGVKSFAEKQKAPRFSFGGEGKLVFQPDGSDWVFTAAVRFGRSNSKKHTHYQGPQIFNSSPYVGQIPKYAAAFSDTLVNYRESHSVLDFTVGKDIGIGMLGRGGSSTLAAGVRVAQFSIKSDTSIYARPDVEIGVNAATFYQYILNGTTERNFRGIGPSLSWNASAALIGNAEEGQITLDWGINGSVLFGRQEEQLDHATSAYHFLGSRPKRQGRNVPLYNYTHTTNRSHSVTVPNLGGFAGLSMRRANAKVSFGYRADFFFGATDTGIDARRTSDLGFHGPFATISIGLGG
ncbi:MAG TPA: hypothetical protein VMS78_03775 [Rhizomicrobium sp.]|nr:hypothetical protein [Rhizomicrobium sp.]